MYLLDPQHVALVTASTHMLKVLATCSQTNVPQELSTVVT
jgi:hypothetical protein